LLFKELEDPIVLDLNEGRQTFFEEDQWVHFPEKLVAPWIVAFLPEVFTDNPELHLFFSIFGRESLVLGELRHCLKFLNVLVDFILFPILDFMLDFKLGLGNVDLEFLPCVFTFLSFLNGNSLVEFVGLHLGFLLVEVPVKHLSQEITLKLRLTEEPVKVHMLTHDSDVSDVQADHVVKKVYHRCRVVVSSMEVAHPTFCNTFHEFAIFHPFWHQFCFIYIILHPVAFGELPV